MMGRGQACAAALAQGTGNQKGRQQTEPTPTPPRHLSTLLADSSASGTIDSVAGKSNFLSFMGSLIVVQSTRKKAPGSLCRNICRFMAALACIAVPFQLARASDDHGKDIPRTPMIDGDWWQVAYSPKLPEIASEPGQVVDHCFFRAANGKWQLWTQIRGTAIGRLFYRWEGSHDFEQADWQPKGICWRANRKHGESWESGDQEFIHAPYVMEENDGYVMYYGGGPSSNKDHCQVNVATSSDGVHFTRIRDPNGLSQIFLGPGWARDPMVLRIGEQYFNYYCADEEGKGVICLRTSPNSTGAPWSEYEVVSEGGILGAHRSSQQCPFVVHIDGYYYLFKMAGSDEYRTAVYRSRNPRFFGTGDDQLIAILKSSASEIIRGKDQFYISSLIPGYTGVRVARLKWDPPL
jgi:hypothetical protein